MDERRIASFLAGGLKPSQIASIIGCTPSYITQLSSTEQFKFLLAEEQAKQASAAAKNEQMVEEVIITNKYLAVEHNILNRLENQMAYADIKELTRALEVVGNRQEARAKRQLIQRLPQLNDPNKATLTLSLSVPAHTIPEYSVNERKEITAVGSKLMAPLSSEGVKTLFDRLSGRIREINPILEPIEDF